MESDPVGVGKGLLGSPSHGFRGNSQCPMGHPVGRAVQGREAALRVRLRRLREKDLRLETERGSSARPCSEDGGTTRVGAGVVLGAGNWMASRFPSVAAQLPPALFRVLHGSVSGKDASVQRRRHRSCQGNKRTLSHPGTCAVPGGDVPRVRFSPREEQVLTV